MVLNLLEDVPKLYTPSTDGTIVLLACMFPIPFPANTKLLFTPVTEMVLPVITTLVPAVEAE